MPLVECVVNISEGKDIHKLEKLANCISSVPKVKLLHQDRGIAANRTVFTFAGEPDKVMEAAFQLFKCSFEILDMSRQKGTHPRLGAIDVCPFIPLQGISIDELKELVKEFAIRVGEEIGTPIYLYEENASSLKRQNLAHLRKGEYESLPEKLEKIPLDYGNPENWKKCGISTIGVRKMLIAYNINLDTNEVSKAKKIAQLVRESGMVVVDSYGDRERIPGRFKSVKALGWYIKDFDKVQVSYNLTDLDKAGILDVFIATKEEALKIDCQVTGSELVGLSPLSELSKAGLYFNGGIPSSEESLIKSANMGLGLSEIEPFIAKNKVIEYLI